jgi:PAS domain S-box-containing protein
MDYQRVEDAEPISDQMLINKNHALEDEIKNLRARLAEAEELQRAISEGDLDALVISRPEGELIFTLNSADRAYRVLVETMSEGTATLGFDGTILYCNRRFAELLRMHPQDIVSKSIYRFIAPEDSAIFRALLERKKDSGKVKLHATGGKSIPVYLSISSMQVEDSQNAWCIVVTDLTDITEHMKNEEALKKAYEEIQAQSEEIQVQNEELQAQSEELQIANEALADSEERFRTMANAIPQLAWIARADGYIYWYNERWYAYTGTTPEHMEGWGWESVHDPAVLPKVLKQWKVSIATGKPFDMEFPLRGSDGIFRQFLTRAIPLKDANGHVFQWFGTNTDITERKQMEEKIRQRAEELEMVMDVAPIAIWIGHDPQCHYITGNRTANEFYEAEIGENVSANVTPVRRFFYKGCELDADELPMQQASLKDIDIRNSEFDVLLPSGEWRALLGSASPLHDANGHVRGSVGAFVDITERKKAEVKLKHTLDNLDKLVKERTAELEKAYNSLKESERSLAEAQQIAHIGNWSRDIVTGEVHWSDEVYRIFGFKPQEFGISYDSFLSQVVPEDREFVINTGKQALNGKFFESEYRIIRADGVERVVHENVKAIFDKENNPFHLIGTIQDITERKKAEEALARIDIARKKEIHHRIKNNLQVISSLLDLQAEQFRDKECIKDSEVLEAFKESQDRVISMALIHEELYKGCGFETLNFSPYIHELAENLFQTYSVGNNNISLKLDLEENTYLDMDIAVPLGIIVNELVTNSFKHAFKGRESGVIHIKLNQEENEECLTNVNEDCTTFVLTVSDNGIGIPEDIEIEELDSLGMQLVITLVDQLDGELEIKRENGTEFTVRFTVPENNNSTKEASLPRMADND